MLIVAGLTGFVNLFTPGPRIAATALKFTLCFDDHPMTGGCMNITSTTALTGVQAASLRMESAAHNIANAHTPNFQRQVVTMQTQESAGVLTTIGKAEEIGAALAADLVEQMGAAAAYRANLRMIQADQQTTGSLLDLKA